MLKNDPPSGSIVNSSSFLANMGSSTGQMAYNAAKAAVAQLSRDLGTSLARQGIRVNAISLGPIDTPQLTEVFSRIGKEERMRRFAHMPLGRFGTLDELATIAFLASEDSGFITASVFPLDGGIQHAFTVPE
jgi:NAD(P)-dependent dehydrogenase (short-subunit alcohol dehydrogenase family)